jgi:hypothetical protein
VNNTRKHIAELVKTAGITSRIWRSGRRAPMKWLTISIYKDMEGNEIHEVKCSNCGHRETIRVDNVPKRCYLCEQEDEDL